LLSQWERAVIEMASVGVTHNAIAYESYAFFGIPFTLGSDHDSFCEMYRETYRGMRIVTKNGQTPRAVTFTVHASGTAGSPVVNVEGAHVPHLVDVFRGGTNRHRFLVQGSSVDGEYEIADRFLGNRPVMSVGQSSCRLLDEERWRAYAESVVFHTILSEIPGYLALHAGVVSRGNKGLILCGESNSGKTTLTLGLVRAGLKFLSDEVAFMERKSGNVLPFPRSPGIREKSLAIFSDLSVHELRPTKALSGDDKWLLDVRRWVDESIGGPCRPDVILFLEGFAEKTLLTPIAASEAVFRCLKFSHSEADDPFAAMLGLADVLSNTRCYTLLSGPPAETVEQVASLVRE
jgi:hypothetical protein